ncbi:MAG: SO_0444 family Cu/Zn efflux transporter [Eubacteriales bacterium]
MIRFFEVFLNLFVDMAYYLMLGLTLVGIFNLFVNRELIARQLGKNSFWSTVKACALGVPLPLCSCAVVPTGMYLKDKGASTATTTAFLISTPQTGVDSIVATYGLMGPTFAWFRPVAAFLSGVLGGFFVGLFDKKKHAENDSKHIHHSDGDSCCSTDTGCTDGSCAAHKEIKKSDPFGKKLADTMHYAYIESVGEIAIHFLVGLLIATLITMFLPTDLIMRANLNSGILAMLLMIVIGMPMYICSTASIPIAVSFILKGISPGAAFVFLFMGPFTNAASLSILAKKLGKKVVALYVSISSVLAVLFGLLLDFLINQFNLKVSIAQMGENANEEIGIFKLIVTITFAALLLYSLGGIIMNNFKAKKASKNVSSEGTTYDVYGMTCNGCSSRLQAQLLKDENIENAVVDHENNKATVYGNASAETVKTIVENAGFSMAK